MTQNPESTAEIRVLLVILLLSGIFSRKRKKKLPLSKSENFLNYLIERFLGRGWWGLGNALLGSKNTLIPISRNERVSDVKCK